MGAREKIPSSSHELRSDKKRRLRSDVVSDDSEDECTKTSLSERKEKKCPWKQEIFCSNSKKTQGLKMMMKYGKQSLGERESYLENWGSYQIDIEATYLYYQVI